MKALSNFSQGLWQRLSRKNIQMSFADLLHSKHLSLQLYQNIKKSMKNKVLNLSLFITALFGCKKDTNPCLEATIIYSNVSSDPYLIYLDGDHIATVQGNQSVDARIERGAHVLRAIQESGFTLFPIDTTSTVYLDGCDSVKFTFP